MSFEEMLKQLQSQLPPSSGWELGLQRMRCVLKELGNPHLGSHWVHVAGTNGKGSVCAMVHAILREAGFRTGLYISPHLERFEERISVNGKMISSQEAASHFERVMLAAEEAGVRDLTFFEAVTVAAFSYFKDQGISLGVIEVGLGGRWDATNVIEDPLVCVITPVSLDHTEWLGNTVGSIAREKAAIIKRGCIAVSSPQPKEAAVAIQEACVAQGCKLMEVRDQVAWEELEFGLSGQRVRLRSPRREISDLFIPLLGRHQQVNAATAVLVADALCAQGIEVPDEAVVSGIAKVKWPGRLEIVQRDPLIILDGAHNPGGAEVLAQALRELFPESKITLLMGMLKDKPVGDVVRTLVPVAHRVVVTTPPSHRALSAQALAEHVGTYTHNVIVQEVPAEALEVAREMLEEDGVLCVTGSLYLVGHLRGCLVGAGCGNEDHHSRAVSCTG
ncbi:MAG: bifunctional folylpolyglutamate synthase/dihydrofolate synthase [Bacillota bacterium]